MSLYIQLSHKKAETDILIAFSHFFLLNDHRSKMEHSSRQWKWRQYDIVSDFGTERNGKCRL